MGALHWRGDARVNFKVIFHALMDAIVLPSSQADQSITPLALSFFEHDQRGKDTDKEEVKRSEELDILHYPLPQQNVIDDQIVSLCSHRGDGMLHASEGSVSHRPRFDDN